MKNKSREIKPHNKYENFQQNIVGRQTEGIELNLRIITYAKHLKHRVVIK
jgi:hypothetical protein